MSTTFIRETGEAVTLDLTTRESFDNSAIISQHPIASGSNVVDHAQSRNGTITVAGRFDRFPLKPGGQSPALDGVDGRVRLLIEKLLEILRAGERISVSSITLGLIENALIERIPIESTNQNSVTVTVVLQRIEIAERVTVQIPPLRTTEEGSVDFPDETDTGQQPTTNPESTEEAQSASILYGLVDSFGFI